MKKLLFVVLVFVFVFGLAAAAYAAAVPISEDGVTQGGYLPPTAGQNPHGLYSTTSNKCKVCHAVHGAAGGEALLRSSRAGACEYCHITPGFGIKEPYGSDPDLYYTDYENNHAANHDGLPGIWNGCVSCHSVHGANTWSNVTEGITYGKILRDNPGGTLPGAGANGALAAVVTNLDNYCRDCHDGTTNGTTGSTCTNCHPGNALWGVTKLATRNGVSHIMTTQTNGNYGTQVAWNPSDTCRTCHKGAATYADGNSFPHITSGAQFLSDTHTDTSPLDRVCLECHRNPGNTSGVGLTF